MQTTVPSVPAAAAKRNWGRLPYFWARTETNGLYIREYGSTLSHDNSSEV